MKRADAKLWLFEVALEGMFHVVSVACRAMVRLANRVEDEKHEARERRRGHR